MPNETLQFHYIVWPLLCPRPMLIDLLGIMLVGDQHWPVNLKMSVCVRFYLPKYCCFKCTYHRIWAHFENSLHTLVSYSVLLVSSISMNNSLFRVLYFSCVILVYQFFNRLVVENVFIFCILIAGLAEADANEVEAIAKVFAKKKPIKVGSVKSNLGHTQAVSGACSLTKVH